MARWPKAGSFVVIRGPSCLRRYKQKNTPTRVVGLARVFHFKVGNASLFLKSGQDEVQEFFPLEFARWAPKVIVCAFPLPPPSPLPREPCVLI